METNTMSSDKTGDKVADAMSSNYDIADWTQVAEGRGDARGECWSAGLDDYKSRLVVIPPHQGTILVELTHGNFDDSDNCPAIGAVANLTPDDAESLAEDLLRMVEIARTEATGDE